MGIKTSKTIVAALLGFLFISAGIQHGPRIVLPDALIEKLRENKKENDLTTWIYNQLDWVTEDPVKRSSLLKEVRNNAWRIPETTEESQAWLLLLINDGHTMLLSGNIVASTDAYRAALKWVKDKPAITNDEQVLEYILKPLGNNYTRLGDYEQALYIQQKAVEVARSLNDNNAISATYSNIASTCSSMENFMQSLVYCSEGLKHANYNNAIKGLLYSEQSEAFMKLNLKDSAIKSIQKSIYLLEHNRPGNPGADYWLLMAYQQAGDIYQDAFMKAEGYYNKAVQLQARLEKQNGAIHQRERAKLYYRLGFLYKKTGLYDKADYWLQQCATQLLQGKSFSSVTEKDLYGENTLVDLFFTRGDLSVIRNNINEALHLYEMCFAAEKRLRNEYITESGKERSVANSRLRYETAIDVAFSAWQQTQKPVYKQQALAFMESSKAQLLLEEVKLQQQYEQGSNNNDSTRSRVRFLEKALVFYQKKLMEVNSTGQVNKDDESRLKNIEWELADLKKHNRNYTLPGGMNNTRVPDFEKTISHLNHSQVVRSFFTGIKAIYTIELDSSGITLFDRQHILSGYTDTIKQFISRYFQNGPDEMLNHPKKYYQEAYNIYHTTFGKQAFQSSREYILLADGILSSLPVEALVTAPVYISSIGNWPFVIRTANISYAYSLQVLKEQFKQESRIKHFTGFFISENNKKGPELQSVMQEKESIAESIKSGFWLINEKATIAAFHKALEESSVLHLSTHASASKDNSIVPHIQLYDAPFYLFELKGIPYHPSLAVLSACRTGDGRLISGEGVQSIARAFAANGTNAVIAGWWNVNDKTTAQIMSTFYAALATGATSSGALKQAKMHWLNNDKTPYLQKLPYYWAAVNYMGNPDALKNNNWMTGGTFDGNTLSVISIILLLLCILLFWQKRQKWISRRG